MTFNIQDGGIGREGKLLQYIQGIEPQILVLQEVTELAIIHHCAEQLEMHVVVASGSTKRKAAVLSHYPIKFSKSSSIVPNLSRDFLKVQIEYAPNKFLNVFGVHLAAQPFMLFEWFRVREIKRVLYEALLTPHIPCLIAGDFNAVSPSDETNINRLAARFRLQVRLQGNHIPRKVISTILAAQFVDCYRSMNHDHGYTLPPQSPGIRFDYIFANQALFPSLKSCRVITQFSNQEYLSDHYPVIAEFEI